MRPLKLTPKLIGELTDEFREQLQEYNTHTDRINYSKNLSDIFKKTSDEKTEKIQVNFTADAYLKMMQLVSTCPDEIGWHGTVQRVSDTKFIVDEILVFPQIVSGTEVTPDETAFNKWMLQFFEDDEDTTIQRMRFHGHSHVNMGTTPSGTDDRYQADMLGNIKDYYIFLITNKKADHNVMVYDVQHNRYLDKTDIILGIELSNDINLADWTNEQMKLVTKRSTIFKETKRETTIVTKPNLTVEEYFDEQQALEQLEMEAELNKSRKDAQKDQTKVHYNTTLKLWVVENHKGGKQFFTYDPRKGKVKKTGGK